MTHRLIQCSAAASLILLAACGGGSGGGGETPQTTPFADTGGTDTVSISAVSLNSRLRAIDIEGGEFDQDADTFAIGDLSGSINEAGDTVILTSGGQIDIIAGSTEHAARFIATPSNGDRMIGIVGFETEIADLPTGSVSYTGTSELTILDGTSIYALTGDTRITADFGSALVDTTVNNLDGTVTAGAGAPADVTDVATITFTGSGITDARFTGGTATMTSSTLTGLSGSETSDLDGAFYGPGADEAGAAFIIDDAANDGITVFGTALAD